MPGQIRNVLDWPYVEGLRLDEALNPPVIESPLTNIIQSV